MAQSDNPRQIVERYKVFKSYISQLVCANGNCSTNSYILYMHDESVKQSSRGLSFFLPYSNSTTLEFTFFAVKADMHRLAFFCRNHISLVCQTVMRCLPRRSHVIGALASEPLGIDGLMSSIVVTDNGCGNPTKCKQSRITPFPNSTFIKQ